MLRRRSSMIAHNTRFNNSSSSNPVFGMQTLLSKSQQRSPLLLITEPSCSSCKGVELHYYFRPAVQGDRRPWLRPLPLTQKHKCVLLGRSWTNATLLEKHFCAHLKTEASTNITEPKYYRRCSS